MKISREGVVLIKSFEGFRPRALKDRDGRWVVGYGHTASAHEGAVVSEAEAELLLQYDLIPVQTVLSEVLTRPVNQHQYDALASFAFSVGVEAFRTSEVASQVNSGDATEAAEALAAWPEAPIRDAGLRRRAAERALFTADPSTAVTLSDLLSAPVPGPAAAEPFTPATRQDADEVPIFAPVMVQADPEKAAAPADAEAQADDASKTAVVPVAEPLTGAAETAGSGNGITSDTGTTGPVAEAAASAAPRLVWPNDGSADDSSTAQGRLDLSSQAAVWADPFDPKPAGFSWRRVWPYLLMGGFGLVSLAMSMAALRKASTAASDVTSILAIAAVLAIIGAACVGVSAYNIYQRLSDDR